MPLVGTNTSSLSSGIKPAFAVEMCFQAAQAMAFLHSIDICHGDFTTNNFALDLPAKLPSREEDLFKLIGMPETAPVETVSDKSPEPHAPRYVVDTLDFCTAPVKLLTSELRVFDFDQSFRNDAPRERNGTPAKYMAPEVCCGDPPSKASVVWSLGCAIYRLRSGDDLFFDFDTGSPKAALQQIERFLGDLPDELARAPFDDDGHPTKDKGDTPLIYSDDRATFREYIAKIHDAPPSLMMTSKGEVDTEPRQPEPSRWEFDAEKRITYPSVYDSMFRKPTAIRIEGSYMTSYSSDQKSFHGAFPQIRREEAELLLDLFTRIFVYDPSSRMTAEEVSKYPWFRLYGCI